MILRQPISGRSTLKSTSDHINAAALILDRLSERVRPSEKLLSRILEKECPDWSRDEIAELMELCLFIMRREQYLMMDRIVPFMRQSEDAFRRHRRASEVLHITGSRVFSDQRREASERAQAEISARLQTVFGPALRGEMPDDEDQQ